MLRHFPPTVHFPPTIHFLPTIHFPPTLHFPPTIYHPQVLSPSPPLLLLLRTPHHHVLRGAINPGPPAPRLSRLAHRPRSSLLLLAGRACRLSLPLSHPGTSRRRRRLRLSLLLPLAPPRRHRRGDPRHARDPSGATVVPLHHRTQTHLCRCALSWYALAALQGAARPPDSHAGRRRYGAASTGPRTARDRPRVTLRGPLQQPGAAHVRLFSCGEA